MERTDVSARFPLGSKLPTFSLMDVSGKTMSDDYLRSGKAALVVFSCNHCPYVKGSEATLIETVREFNSRGLRAVAINSNDAAQYPDDSFENMKLKAKDMNIPYPYLYDKTQEVAKMFDAACTPECYLFDEHHSLVFHGTINDNPKDPNKASKTYLRDAIEQLLSGKKPKPAFVHPLGCSIKWRA